MEPQPSTSSQTFSEEESSFAQSKLLFMPSHDVAVFGQSSDLSDINLPCNRDILQYYFFLGDHAKIKNKIFSHKTFTPHVADKLSETWNKLNIKIINKKSVLIKLNTLLDKYKEVIKHKERSSFKAFTDTLKNIFYIGQCKCDLRIRVCSCGLIPDHLKEFMLDQHNERKSTIPEYVAPPSEQVLSEIPTIATTNDPTYEPDSDMYGAIPESASDVEPALQRGHYTPRYSALRFATMCNRFGVTDRVASCLATALLEDFNIRDDRGELIIMDKSKVAREKQKSRDLHLCKRYGGSSISAFSFDGRKDDSLTREKIDHRFHQNMIKEAHLVIAKEPNTTLLGYVKLDSEAAEYKQRKLNDFFIEKELSIEELLGICCDGEPANTGTENGVLRRFELQLKKPLHWFVCLLHFNELPFRHLYETLERSLTTGPRTLTGRLAQRIEECHTLQVINDFEPIPLENMPPLMEDKRQHELSTDVQYLYRMANAVSNGFCPADLANIRPGPIANSRWITKASRLLRLYVTTKKPSSNLKILAVYIMKVYIPMYFNVKYYNSVVYGSALLSKYIRWTQYLNPNLKKIIQRVVNNNSYFAHSENVILTMLFDDRKAIRDRAIRRILYFRDNLYDPTTLRAYVKPVINYNCMDYVDMIDLNDDNILSEPPFTRNIPYEHFIQYLEVDDDDDPPFPDPKFPCHIQGTERHVQLLTSVSRRVTEKYREGVMAATIESRKSLPRFESKQDFKH